MNPSAPVLIDVSNLTKAYGGRIVLDDISIQVHEGEVLAIIGTSGCGKSTLLRLMCGLDTPDAGDIHLYDPNYSMVFQYSALFDSLTVFENVAFSLMEESDDAPKGGPLKPKLSDPEIIALVKEKLHLVGLDGIEMRYPNELSGGMQKRVSFARAIVSNPRIIFYDEPTAGLDPIASTVIENYILTLRDQLGAASVVVTHQHSTIHRTADRVCLLHGGQVRWLGTPDELEVSDNPYALQFATSSLIGPMTGDLV
ncbi:MAG: ATP-binding cassette domain-containing protein [Cyanobacteria bacterium]|nr:ATP-binding cassette domain-containing protein [Cyanobacteriota bacterium]